MSEQTEEIKSRLDIVDFVSGYVTLKKAGNNWKGLCPFHQEKTPSFMVSREKQIFKCFGCGASGDLLAFLMQIENLEFPEALEILADRTGVQLPQKRLDREHRDSKDTISKNRLYELNRQSAKFFYTLLVKHRVGQSALAYLQKRGVSEQSMRKFLLGFVPDQPVLKPWLQKKGFNETELKAAGNPDRFNSRIMFPFHDVMGNIIAFSGRATKEDQQPKYLHTAETSLFHKSRYIYGLHQARQSIRSNNSIVIVEGQLDVILSSQVGVENVVCMSGTALTDDQIRIINRYTDNVIVGYDADDAGVKATDEALRRLLNQGLTVKVITMPDGFKDAGDVVASQPEKWTKAVASASHAIPWLIQTTPVTIQLSVEHKKAIAKRVLPILALLPDSIEQAHWVEYVSHHLRVPPVSITKALNRLESPQKGQPSSSVQQTQKLSTRELLLALLEKLPDMRKDYQDLYEELRKWYTKNVDELMLLFDHLHLKVSPADLQQEFQDAVAKYSQEKRETVKEDFAQAIAAAEQTGDRKKAKELVEKLYNELKGKSNTTTGQSTEQHRKINA